MEGLSWNPLQLGGFGGGFGGGPGASLSLRAAPIDPSPAKAAPLLETPGAAAWALFTSHLPV